MLSNVNKQKYKIRNENVTIQRNAMIQRNLIQRNILIEKDKKELVEKSIHCVIPLILHQFWHSNELPDSVKESIENIKSNNPEFKHCLYNATMSRDFIKEEFDSEVLYAYDSLIPYALKVDLWRYCILYKKGGIYLDSKYQCIDGFKFIYLTDEEYLCRDLKESGYGIYNALMICKPGNKLLLECINKIVKNTKEEYYGDSGLEISGPLMIKSFVPNSYDIKLFHTYSVYSAGSELLYYICYKNFPILQIHPRYRKDQSKLGEHWYEFYNKKQIYVKKYEILNYHQNKSMLFQVYENCCISERIKNGFLWEEHMHILFEKYIQPDFISLEAGCHIGTHTLKLASLCSHVYAFEPFPESNRKLDYNLRTNHIKNVTLSNKGLSNCLETMKYGWTTEGNPGASGLSNNPMGIPSGISVPDISVELITMDSLGLEKLDFIKLDVEGYEELVIQGGVQTIQKCKPIITLESWSSHKGEIDIDSTKKRFHVLLEMGYQMLQVYGPDFIFLPPSI